MIFTIINIPIRTLIQKHYDTKRMSSMHPVTQIQGNLYFDCMKYMLMINTTRKILAMKMMVGWLAGSLFDHRDSSRTA
jgi:hypothetical protein